MDKKKKQQERLFMIIFFGVIAFLITTIFGMHMGYVQDGEKEMPTVIMDAITHLSDEPLIVMPFSKYTWEYSFMCYIPVMIGLLCFWTYLKTHDYDDNASGNASWNEDLKAYNKKYTSPFGKGKDKSGYDNMILSQDVFLSMNGYKTRRNSNVLVVGGSGSGKSRFVVKPNALQFNSSYVFTDPKGELLESLGHALEENGYEIKVFNLKNMYNSMSYNPYNYIRDENGVRSMVKCIIDNTRGTDKNTGEPIWEDGMTALLQAISFYMIEKFPKEERNFHNVMRMLRLAKVDENNADNKSPLDIMFEKLEKENEESMAVKSYKTFNVAAGKTLKSFLSTTMTRLDVFNMKAVASLTNTDTIHLEELGMKRQALFIIIPSADKTYNFLAATLYTQLFETLYHLAEDVCPHAYFYKSKHETFLWDKDKEELKKKIKMIPTSTVVHKPEDNRYYIVDEKTGTELESFLTEKKAKWFLKNAVNGKISRGGIYLPYDIRFLLDEFANTGRIPGFVEKLATMRSYRISCTIILQNNNQLETMYEKDAGTIIGNCDTFLFLGSQEKDTIEYVITMLSKTTKTQKSTNFSYGKGKGSSEGLQKTGADLMTFNEIREMDDSECVVLIRGQKPFKGPKFEYTKHKNYELTGDANSDYIYKNMYDNRKKEDIERDEKENEEAKKKRYEQELKKGEKKVISMVFDASELFKKICENHPERLGTMLAIDKEEETVAQTDEEKEKAKEQFEQSEEDMKKVESSDNDDEDLWEEMSDLL